MCVQGHRFKGSMAGAKYMISVGLTGTENGAGSKQPLRRVPPARHLKTSGLVPRFGQLLLWKWSPHRILSLLLLKPTPEHLFDVSHGEGTDR